MLIIAAHVSYALAVLHSRTHVGGSAYRLPREEEETDLRLHFHNKVAVADVQPRDVPFGRQLGVRCAYFPGYQISFRPPWLPRPEDQGRAEDQDGEIRIMHGETASSDVTPPKRQREA